MFVSEGVIHSYQQITWQIFHWILNSDLTSSFLRTRFAWLSPGFSGRTTANSAVSWGQRVHTGVVHNTQMTLSFAHVCKKEKNQQRIFVFKRSVMTLFSNYRFATMEIGYRCSLSLRDSEWSRHHIHSGMYPSRSRTDRWCTSLSRSIHRYLVTNK